jgi:adenylate cyclase
MDTADFEAAGLYDPRAPDAADRLALLRWLAAHGFTREQMLLAQRQGSLTALALDVALRPGRRLTLVELAARIGIPPGRLGEIRLAAGLPQVDPEEPAFSEDEVATFAAFVIGAAQFGEVPTRRFVRVMGSSLARIAEAALSLFYVNVEGPIREAGAGQVALAEANLRAIETLQVVPKAMAGLFHAHMEAVIQRFRQARRAPSGETAYLTVGFVDLVGFTTLSRRMTTHELATVVDRFEDTAHEVATVRGGRIVKLVGDEVMFVTVTAAPACDIALALVERFAGDPSITPRGGLATGDLLIRGGDYYGPIVNLAARLAELAVPKELLVTPEVAAQAGSAGLRFEPAGKRVLKGFDEPVTLLTVERA